MICLCNYPINFDCKAIFHVCHYRYCTSISSFFIISWSSCMGDCGLSSQNTSTKKEVSISIVGITNKLSGYSFFFTELMFHQPIIDTPHSVQWLVTVKKYGSSQSFPNVSQDLRNLDVVRSPTVFVRCKGELKATRLHWLLQTNKGTERNVFPYMPNNMMLNTFLVNDKVINHIH